MTFNVSEYGYRLEVSKMALQTRPLCAGLIAKQAAEDAQRQLAEKLERDMFAAQEANARELVAITAALAANETKRRAFFARLEMRIDDPPLSAADVALVRAECDVIADEWRKLLDRKRVLEAWPWERQQ